MSFDINNFQSNCIGKSGDIVVITTQDFNKSNYIKSDNQTISITGTVDLNFYATQNLTINKNDIIYTSNGNLGIQGPQGPAAFFRIKSETLDPLDGPKTIAMTAALGNVSLAYHAVVCITAVNAVVVSVTPYIDLLPQASFMVKVSGNKVGSTCEIAVPLSGILSITGTELVYLKVELDSYAHSAVGEIKFVYNTF